MRSFVFNRLYILLVCLLVGACTPPTYYASDTLNRQSGSPKIVALSPDIELSQVRASGIPEVNAAWTNVANDHFGDALHKKAIELGAGVRVATIDQSELGRHDPIVKLIKLHGAVGTAVNQHHFSPTSKLPHKKNKFDWTLGPDATVLREKYDADYALFIYLRDSYTSTGRAAVILIGALFGVAVQGGTQLGYASLVDVSSGDIVWFNRLFRASGDMRTPEGASETLEVLLKDFPS